mmetsp:Transcript_24360/g.71704  ORF Transcript_24360/g.71704 Transcript_24360/m.71704 type:complete len:255 (+) Transcript_24360:1879-2643(+)
MALMEYSPGLPYEAAKHAVLSTGQWGTMFGKANARAELQEQRADKEAKRADDLQAKLKLATSALRKFNDGTSRLGEDEVSFLQELQNCTKQDAGTKKKVKQVYEALGPSGKYETIKEFRKRLESHGLITSQPGAPDQGQHVFHIIANSNGGPDHTHNYLYALGASFNTSIGDRLDHLNCFLAGREAAKKAVAISLKTAQDPSLHKHIEKRSGKRTLYTQGIHKDVKDGGMLFDRGQSLFRRAIMSVNREDNKQK